MVFGSQTGMAHGLNVQAPPALELGTLTGNIRPLFSGVDINPVLLYLSLVCLTTNFIH